MADASLNRRMTIRLGPNVGFAQIGICGFDGVIDLQALRLYGLPEAACSATTIVTGTVRQVGRWLQA